MIINMILRMDQLVEVTALRRKHIVIFQIILIRARSKELVQRSPEHDSLILIQPVETVLEIGLSEMA